MARHRQETPRPANCRGNYLLNRLMKERKPPLEIATAKHEVAATNRQERLMKSASEAYVGLQDAIREATSRLEGLDDFEAAEAVNGRLMYWLYQWRELLLTETDIDPDELREQVNKRRQE